MLNDKERQEMCPITFGAHNWSNPSPFPTSQVFSMVTGEHLYDVYIRVCRTCGEVKQNKVQHALPSNTSKA